MSRRRFHALLAGLAASLLLATSPLSVAAEKAETVKTWRIALNRDVYTDYQHFIGQRNPLALQHFGGPFSRRDIVELVLLQQALHRGGVSRPLRFVLADSDSRQLKILASGEADISGGSMWKSSLEPYRQQLLASTPVIQTGRFMAGLYFPEHHPALKTLPTQPQDIRRYIAICTESWTPDLDSLRALGSPVLKTENWDSMIGMLRKQRGDFVLAPFQPTPGLRLEVQGMVLLPVNGLKVSLSGSRHFVIWNQDREAPQLMQALNKGLLSLEQDGTLQRAYRESGFENAETRNWRILNP